MISVLFVCMGNICRSPMAEAVFQDMVDKAGLSQHFKIDSAGMGPWHVGESAHEGTLAILTRQNIAYKGIARQIAREDFNRFDYVLLADREVQSYMRQYTGGRAKVDYILGAAYRAGTVTTQELLDPYYNGRFNDVYELVLKGCEALLAEIRAENGL